jgi:hypothetical protein
MRLLGVVASIRPDRTFAVALVNSVPAALCRYRAHGLSRQLHAKGLPHSTIAETST